MSETQRPSANGTCTYEWNIHNFSYWHPEMYEIGNSDVFMEKYYLKLELFPKGREGHLVATCCGPYIDSDLTFHGPDGSLIFKQTLNSWDDDLEELDVERLIYGPKFEDVLARIKQSDPRHGDRLTLRFSESTEFGDTSTTPSVVVVHTHINVVETTLKVSTSLLRSFEDPRFSRVACLYYPSDLQTDQELRLDICESHDSGLLLFELEPTDHPIVVHVRTSVLDKEGSVIRTEEKKNFFWWREKWTFSDSLWLHEVEQMELSLLLHFKIVPYVAPDIVCGHYSTHPGIVSAIPYENSDMPDENSTANLVRDFKCLHLDKEFTDFQLKCKGVTFPVHRTVLSVRSPVFKAMLSNDLKEAACGWVDIQDMQAPMLELFLRYLYTGAVEGMQWDSAIKLYYASEKYQVPCLKKKCANFLCANVSMSNVIDVMVLGFVHRDYQLNSAVHQFVLENHEEAVRDSKVMAVMAHTGPVLVAKVIYQKCMMGVLDHCLYCDESNCPLESLVTEEDTQTVLNVIKMNENSTFRAQDVSEGTDSSMNQILKILSNFLKNADRFKKCLHWRQSRGLITWGNCN